MRTSKTKAQLLKLSMLRISLASYVLIISGIIMIISSFAWMTISQNPAVGALGFGIQIPGPALVYETWDGSFADINNVEMDENGVYIVKTPAEFATVMALSTDYKMYGVKNITIKIANHLDMAGLEWTPIKIDSYAGFGTITIQGEGHCMRGFSAPMFEGGFGGDAGIVIRDIAIVDSNIVSKNTQGSGAFIEVLDSVSTIELDNCHLVRSTLYGSRTGGLIGWTAGYNNTSDGAVKSYVNIKNCSVDGCKITGSGTVGGIIGQAGANAWTFQLLENCEVNNTTLTSTSSSNKGIGTMIGTANVGEITLVECKSIGVTEIGADTLTDKIYGRLALGNTGKIADIHDTTVYVYGGFIQSAVDKVTADNQIWLIHDTVTVSSEIRFKGDNIIIAGVGDSGTLNLDSVATGYVWTGLANSSSGFNFGEIGQYVNNTKPGSTMQFLNLTINNNKTLKNCTSSANRSTSYTYAYCDNAIYKDCIMNGGVVVYGNATFNNCSVNESDSNRYCVFLDNQYGGRENDYTISNCLFDSSSSAYGCVKVADDANENATLIVKESVFNNVVNKAAVYVNGTTSVIATANTFINCQAGEIIAKGDKCTLNGAPCPTS